MRFFFFFDCPFGLFLTFVKTKIKKLEIHEDAEWITRKSHVYHLRGIVIHVGMADRGHYYSFLDKKRGQGGSKVWIFFSLSFSFHLMFFFVVGSI